MILGVTLVAALGAGAWYLRKSKVVLDAENCPQTGPHAVHVIMIDRSDPVSGQQAQRIRQHVQKAKTDAAFGTRFDVYTFEGDVLNEMKPILRVCAPGRAEDANELIENPDLIRRRYDEKFAAVLDGVIDNLLRETSRENSPIIESIRAASITSFGSVEQGKIPLRLTLASDMVQHSTLSSHFRGEANFPQLSKNNAWAGLQPRLKGADVEILYLLRPGATRAGKPIQNRGHQAFWEQLIGASGGIVKSIDPL